MKILGTKFFHHDSAVFLIDSDKEEIFAISTERVTRIKHDNIDIQPILNAYPSILSNLSVVANAFSDFNKKNNPYADLCNSNIRATLFSRQYRKLIKPVYLRDLIDSRFSKFLRL